ncbi:hypothetical protein Egran_06568 [Elaphomyces granulatus]|uniref:Heterokaryon incompatibility domain-containing protein n=1 Tax=Elaphomyces granulatus TaxID=519963 RepID=A0A232LNJ0_9EURO|nr:hypothetical protein Egran_06568 [Elaphomyces granulatus]
MASNTTPSFDGDVVNLQRPFREAEVETRAEFADCLIDEYERGAQRNPQHLRDAIKHSETVLRRLPYNSPDRPQHLYRISYARMSEYVASRSGRAIDEAVRCGRLAREEAVATGLPERDLNLYCQILNNLGAALSHRHANATVTPAAAQVGTGIEEDSSNGSSGTANDLDEAIECAREIKKRATPANTIYSTTLSNLASRLTHRHSICGDPADHTEAVELVQELQSLSPLGSVKGGMAIMHLGQMAVLKFNKTHDLGDLDEALERTTEGIDKLPQGYEGKPASLDQIATLYSSRYKKTNDVADLHNAVHYSDMALATAPVSYSVRGGYLLNHMRLLQDFANAATSVQDVDEAVSKGHRHLMEMQNEYPEQHSCRKFYSDVLGRRYILSQRLEDFANAVFYVKQLCYDYNDKINESGAIPPVNTNLIYNLSAEVQKLSSAPPGQARDAATAKLYDQIVTVCRPHDFVNGVLGIGKEFVTLLGVYADAAHDGETITDDKAHKKAEELRLKEEAELEQRLSRPRWERKGYKTELGLRKLAIDPTNKKIVLDLSGLMTDIFGYDVTAPSSHSEFVAKQAHLEKESVEKAKAKGGHPNPKLCHMCRFIKPLSPTMAENDGGRWGFKWNPEKRFMPFGNWHQLKLRTMCSICRLVLSLIVSDQVQNTLHPRLAAVDWEIQGTTLGVGELASREEVLLVRYGMRQVGELRIVSPRNYTHAIRQGWEDRDQQHEFEEFMGDSGNGKDDGPRSAVGQQVDTIMLKRWLNDCDQNHGEACNISCHGNGASARYVANMPLVFIDVVDHCLVPATSAVKYFALSYMWGTDEMSKTLLANYESRCQIGGLPTRLPNTISDAIALVRALGERYLWVDAQCIVQDDEENKARHIANMDVVYSKAFATVVAIHGDSADAGLPGVRPGTRPPQRIETLVVEAGSRDLDYDPDGGDSSAANVTLHLVATPPPLHFAIEASRWHTRGWTFQERLLSRRCLYFSERYVYFHCGRRDKVLSECGVNGPVRSHDSWDSWDTPGEALGSTTLDNPLSGLHQELADLRPDAWRAKIFTMYSSLVGKYTLRQLSYDSDIINAFLGTFTVLNEFFHSDILCGLPASALDLALLWAPAGRLPRRGQTARIMEGFKTTIGTSRSVSVPTNRGTVLSVWAPSAVPNFDDKADRRFPSWSWAGWKGPVEYRLFAEANSHEPLPTSLVHGFAINLDGKELRTVTVSQGQQQRVVSLSYNLTTAVALTAPAPVQAPGDTVAAVMEGLALSNTDANKSVPIANPGLPNILQFLAPSVPLSAFTVSTECEYISYVDHIHAPGQQPVRHILDRRGKRCGLWWEQAGYVYVGRGLSTDAESKMLLVGISRHEDTFRKRAGPNRVEGEIELFDEVHYPAVGKGSGLVNVLVVDLDMVHDYGVVERVTVARIHAKAWEDAGPLVRMVRLA